MPTRPVDNPSISAGTLIAYGGLPGTMRRLPVPPLLVALPVFLALAWSFRFVCDDAFIAFRYADHLARGLGLRYNLTADPPVEGYSEPLWVLWMAVAEWLGADPVAWANVSSVVAGAVLLVRLVRLAGRRLDGDPRAIFAVAAFFAAFPPVAVWSTGGMATMPFALVLFVLFEQLGAEPSRLRTSAAGAAALTAALLRADGTVLATIVTGAALLGGEDGMRRRLRRAVPVLAMLLSGVLVHTAWRYGYYGELLPNTAHAKVGLGWAQLGRGLRYVATFLLTFPAAACLPAAAAWVARREDRPLLHQALAATAGVALYAIAVGGDFMSMGRFLVPAVPMLALLAGIAVRGIGTATQARLTTATAVLALAIASSVLAGFGLHLVPEPLRELAHFRWNRREPVSEYDHWREMKSNAIEWALLGRALATIAKPGESMPLRAFGAIGYYSGLTIYDQNALIDPELARQPARRLRSPGHDHHVTRAFFADRKPTYWDARVAPTMSAHGYLNRGLDQLVRGVRYRQKIFPLSEARGFPARRSLVVLRRDDAR